VRPSKLTKQKTQNQNTNKTQHTKNTDRWMAASIYQHRQEEEEQQPALQVFQKDNSSTLELLLINHPSSHANNLRDKIYRRHAGPSFLEWKGEIFRTQEKVLLFCDRGRNA
jgi:hypothetical protein